VQKALTVQTSVPTEGAWAWLSDRSVHWRPKVYWQPGTKVTVTAKLYGLAYGNGSFGRGDVTSQFTIGRAQIVKANTQTHRWVVIRDGQQIADYPASFGLDSDPGRVTKSGVHVVMTKHDTYFMTNPAYDYENFEVHWAVRISNNGEFSHGAPWSVGQQGKRNVSHGCANLSTANAKAYFDMAMTGDPVEIVGTNQQLSAKDGDYYDWAISWENWLAKSAV
jgi:lipoprotein-anchoring transpeptidase ErfK/SrfK